MIGMNLRTILLIVFFLLPLIVFSQKEQSIWYVGKNAGIDFTKDEATAITGGVMNAPGGGATMSDAFGNLLLYTDGVTVWNKHHQVMTNGTGLKGNPNTSQTVIIVPRPLHRYRYYIFTTDARKDNAPNALRYSEVDMSLQGGLGAVISKNNLLLEDVSEKITAIFHENNQDFWLLTHTWNTNEFYAYQITNHGIIAPPVISKAGSVYTGSLTTGRGSFRADNWYQNSRLIVTLPDLHIFDKFELESKTGKIYLHEDLSSIYEKAAFAEISFIGNRLYTTSVSGKELYEFDINGTNATGILNSSRLLATGNNLGDLRMGPNGLIYVASTATHTVSSIYYTPYAHYDTPYGYDFPATFLADAIVFSSGVNKIGLPNTFARYVYPPEIHYSSVCYDDSITFTPRFPNSIDSVHWNFDDPASGSENFSNAIRPVHKFKSNKRPFIVQARIFARGHEEVLEQYMYFDGIFSLGNDTTVCFNAGETVLLNPEVSNVHSYQWQDGSTIPIYEVTRPGTYWLEVISDFGNCPVRDSITVNTHPKPLVNLGNDTTICTGKTLLLQAKNAGSSYLWQDGSSDSSFVVSQPGWYRVTVTNTFGCTASDSLRVYYLTPPTIDLGIDTIICEETELLLDAFLPGVTYRWYDGSTDATFNVTKAGIYWVDGAIDICAARDSIIVKTVKNCFDNLFAPNIITPNGDGFNDYFMLIAGDHEEIWQLEIFNRLGKLVYSSTNYKNEWDAEGLPATVYYYSLESDKNRFLKGFVTVMK